MRCTLNSKREGIILLPYSLQQICGGHDVAACTIADLSCHLFPFMIRRTTYTNVLIGCLEVESESVVVSTLIFDFSKFIHHLQSREKKQKNTR